MNLKKGGMKGNKYQLTKEKVEHSVAVGMYCKNRSNVV